MKFRTKQNLLMGAIVIVLIEVGFFLVIGLMNPDHSTMLLAIGPGLGMLALTEIYSSRKARCRANAG